jgi:hypothetical protein
MTLTALSRGPIKKPIRVLLYAPEGLGKSTFASNAPNPIFIGPEDGTAQLDVVRFPQPETWEDIREAVATLIRDEHDFKTFVIDTVDWAEPLLWKSLCLAAGVTSIEDLGGGFGKGYVAALDSWRALLSDLERLREKKGMHIVMLAHSWVRPFHSPDLSTYDRYELKLHQRASGLLKEWCDAVLFGNYETFTDKDQRTKRIKGVSTGGRLVFSVRTAAFDAKNRYGLPERMPLDWGDFYAAVQAHKPADVQTMVEIIKTNADALGGELKGQTLELLAKAGGDAEKVSKLMTWTNTKLGLKAEKETT